MVHANPVTPARAARLTVAVAISALVAACGSDGGGQPSGGDASGGAVTSQGGTSATSGGATANGGSVASGGAANTGGSSTSGGASNAGAGGNSGASAGGNAGAVSTAGRGGGGRGGGGRTGNAGSANAGGRNGGASGGNGGASGNGGNAGSPAAGMNSGGATSGDITVPPGYKLVWHDEFDADGAPDPANWKFEQGFVRNNEDQWYQRDNASVKDGLLVIEARKERVKNPNYSAGSSDWKTSREYAEYTSSSMMTSGLQSWQYGRFEMRARIPTSAGMWPAWWTLGVSGEWPSNGEIDIMEYYNSKVLANVACGTSTRWQAKWDSATKSLSSLGANWSSDFHVWRMDWDDQNIKLYLDDQQLNSSALADMLNADGKSPFKQKAYMIVNLAIGGDNGGDPSKTAFPQRYEVDYLRVFQKE